MKKFIVTNLAMSFVFIGHAQAQEPMNVGNNSNSDEVQIIGFCKQEPFENAKDMTMAQHPISEPMAKTGNPVEQAIQNKAQSFHEKDQDKLVVAEPKNIELEKQQPKDENELSFLEQFDVTE